MLSAVRSGAIGRWRSTPHLLPRLLSSSSSSSSSGTSPARPQAAALLELAEVEKVLRDVRAGDVRVFPVGKGGLHGGACADYMVVATGRSDWHVRNIAQALLYKVSFGNWIEMGVVRIESFTFVGKLEVKLAKQAKSQESPDDPGPRNSVFMFVGLSSGDHSETILIKQKQKGSDRILMPSVEGQQAGKWVVIDSGSIIIHALEEKAREYYDLESIWSKEVSPNTSIQELETSLVKTRRRNLSQKPMKSI